MNAAKLPQYFFSIQSKRKSVSTFGNGLSLSTRKTQNRVPDKLTLCCSCQKNDHNVPGCGLIMMHFTVTEVLKDTNDSHQPEMEALAEQMWLVCS